MGLSCGVVCVILRLAVLIQYRSVTDTHTHTHTHTHTQTHRHTTTAYTTLSIASRGKNWVGKVNRRRVSVCVSVTLRYCIKTTKHRMMEIMPHNSPGTRAFWRQRTWQNSNGATNGGRWVKIGHFRQIIHYTRKQYKTDEQFLQKSNRKSYALYRCCRWLGWRITLQTPTLLHFRCLSYLCSGWT